MGSWENEPTYIDLALSRGFDVEIDVWYKDKFLYLGHDKPDYGVGINWVSERANNLWIHCKNIEALIYLKSVNNSELNYFWHETDKATLTSNGSIWAYPGNQPMIGSISVLPELYNDATDQCSGICSDFIERYK
jgi:hypothetical protein